MKNKYKLKGLTLMETVLYIGLFSIIMLVVINFMLSIQEANGRIQRRANIHQSSEFIEQHLNYSFAKTKSIDATKSIFDNNNGEIVLLLNDGEHTYSLTNEKIIYDSTPITPVSIKIKKFFVEPIYNKKNLIVATRIAITYESTFDPAVNEESNFLYIIR